MKTRNTMGTPTYNFKRTKWHWTQLVQATKYYQINGTKKVLYWNGTLWQRPVKDNQGRYDGWLDHLEKQPTNVKTVKEVNASDIVGILNS